MRLAPLARHPRIWLGAGIGVALLGSCAACSTMVRMPGRSYAGALPPWTPHERELRERLARDVSELATTIGERNTLRPEAYRKSAEWIAAELRAAGYAVQRQTYRSDSMEVSNLVAELPGTDRRSEVVVVGAHYDSVRGTPGADDNASGTAAVLELARSFVHRSPSRTLRFVFFANEEPPYFQREGMGSQVYAASCKQKGENIVGMLSLETIAYYSDAPGSQHYPWPFNWLYPSTGNFLAFVGNSPSTALTRRVVRTFRSSVPLPSEGAAVPDLVADIGWSDHWSFWQFGYPAVMVTDTAIFRDPNYHQADDTPDKLDYERFARAVVGLEAVVAKLAGVAPSAPANHDR